MNAQDERYLIDESFVKNSLSMLIISVPSMYG